MQTSTVFMAANAIALCQWLLLIFLPRWKLTRLLVKYPLVPGLLSLLYVVHIIHFFSVPNVGFGSVEQVRNLFNDDQLLIAGWVHYLAFDLLVGFWILRSGQQKGIPHLVIIPCLLATFMFGPCGLLLYFIVQYLFPTNGDNTFQPDQD